jgi:hypothetical protein
MEIYGGLEVIFMSMRRDPEIMAVLVADGLIINIDDMVKYFYGGKIFSGKIICILPNNFYLKHGKFVPLFGISSGSGDKYVSSTDILEKL